MKMTQRDRRDWSLIIFIIPIGILLMMIAGGIAIRVVPNWRLNIGMGSNLQVGDYAGGSRPALSPLILTPFSWLDTYLTPSGDDIVFVPFIVVEPSATSSATPVATTESPTSTTPSPVVTITTTPSATSVVPTSTKGGGGDGGGDSNTPPSNICNNPSADNYGDPLPCTFPPTTCDDPSADNYGGSLPCTYPPPTCDDPAANNTGDPLPCVYPVTSTPDASQVTSSDNTTLNNIEVGSNPNGTIGRLDDGTYVVLSLSIVVEPTPDGNYDLAYYEFNNGGQVYMDWVIIGISVYNDGHEYYEIFNWGNGTPDNNSNIGDVAGSEDDNQTIALSELYDPDGPGTSPPSAPQTGILIDVDNASSNPPPGTYNYVIIISPLKPPDHSGNSAQIDAVDAVEVPIPPGGGAPIQEDQAEVTPEPSSKEKPDQASLQDSNEIIEESPPMEEADPPPQTDEVEVVTPIQ